MNYWKIIFKDIKEETNQDVVLYEILYYSNIIFNAQTFPKKEYWIDTNNNHWVPCTNYGYWIIKLSKMRNTFFPDIGNIINIFYETNEISVEIKVRVIEVYKSRQSRSCANYKLHLLNYVSNIPI